MDTLEQFLSKTSNIPRSEYVTFNGFRPIYVRKYRNKITIANIAARKPGKGNFRRLLRWITNNYPDYLLEIECVHNQRLVQFLLNNGFTHSCESNYQLRHKTVV